VAAVAAVEFHSVVLAAGGDFPFLEVLAGLVRESEESEVIGACIRALKKMVVRRADAMAAHLQTLVAMAGINGSLPCQAAIAQNEETQFVCVTMGIVSPLKSCIHDTTV
jgi:hypothetical protein